ncbi:hypothetical protein ACHAWO_011359 [Cyclotella atomus]|uniref:TNFR-Cys domain-containing protein n=1 Tax=Cyclotella atomus TaxID=382360 RepID=A0ABD3Q8V4_9STRA
MPASNADGSVSESHDSSSSGSNEDSSPSMHENTYDTGRDTFVSVETIDYSTSKPQKSVLDGAADISSIEHQSNESNRSSIPEENSNENCNDRCTLLSVETIDYSVPHSQPTKISDSTNDQKSVVNEENQPKRPEYVPNGEEPLPLPGIRAESAEDFKAARKKNTINSSNATTASSVYKRDTRRMLEYTLDDEAPLPPGAIEISDPPDDRKTMKAMNHNDGTDVEAQTMTVGISHVSEPPTIRRKVLYPEQSASEPKTNRASNSRTGASIMRYISWRHPSDNMDDVPIPKNASKRKMRNAVATMIVATVIVSIFVIVLVTSTHSENNKNETTTQTSRQDDVVTPSPPTDLANSDLVDNHNFRICNPIDGEDVELCTVGNCFSGPHCSCKIYFRESQSSDVIGFCDSCRVCDLDGNIGFDCGNLGSSVQECPSTASEIDIDVQVIEYSPPKNYIDRFCSLGLDPSTELCFAGECTDDASCQCDMYKREVASGDAIGLCDSCGVCADGGGISSDCTNIGLAKVECSTQEAEDFVYSPPESYTDRFCIKGFDPSVELCFAGECTNHESCQCDMFKRDVDSGDIVGVCDSCSTCEDGGISHDCTNIGSSNVICRDYSWYIESDTSSSGYSTPQLSQGKNNTSSSPVEGSDSSPGTSTVSDYTCADPSNGVQLCQTQLCDEPGCTCDAYFRDTLTQQPVGACSSCTVCDKGAIGLICSIYGVELNLSC